MNPMKNKKELKKLIKAGVIATILLIMTIFMPGGMGTKDDNRSEESMNLENPVLDYNGPILYNTSQLLASDGLSNDYFGASVAISGNWAIVGAPKNNNIHGNDAGAAYIYQFNGSAWVQEVKLTANDGEQNDKFGYSVAINGNHVIVGKPDDGFPYNPSVYIYEYNGSTWTFDQQLSHTGNPDGSTDFFGCSVAIDNDVVVVGAEMHQEGNLSVGTAYIYRYIGGNWEFEDQLLRSNYQHGDRFGTSVDISGDAVVVGSPHREPLPSVEPTNLTSLPTDAAYVFCCKPNLPPSWEQEAKLTASDGVPLEDWFGHSVSIDRDIVIVGAFGDNQFRGSAYIFHKPSNGWTDMTETVKLTASDGDYGDYFGYSVTIDEKIVVIGSPWDDDFGERSGSAFVYKYNGLNWDEKSKLLIRGGDDNYYLGSSVAIDGNISIVGAEKDHSNPECHPYGAAYIFNTLIGDINGDDVVNVDDLLIVLSQWGTSGPGGDVNGDGIVNVDDLLLLLANWS